ncbi:MAG: DUF354 domain-containing protein [Crocinitomicaceae bacterium]|tara:strand:- start:9517 stop:10593 length:1077 start_codon:yes stop_codon:yes gene_type:complete
MSNSNQRILIDIGHPAQVHCFKYIYWDLTKEGYQVKITIKEKEITQLLLDEYKIPYEILSKKKSGLISKILELPLILFRYAKVVIKFKPNIIICRLSIHSVWIGKLFRIKTIALADTEHTKRLDFITAPLVNLKLTGTSYHRELGANHYKFPSNLELLYLHHKRFTFDKTKIQPELLKNKVAILRFVSWQAHHDIGEKGISLSHKRALINTLKKDYTVLISSETTLQKEFQEYEIDIPVGSIHHYLKHAQLYIGEGASMASEAVCLGTPAYYINSLSVGYIREQESYHLVKSFDNSDAFMSTIKEDLKTNFDWYRIDNYRNYITQQIDSTALLTWCIQKHPFNLDAYNEAIAAIKKNN